jgi:hypothetical protein
MALLRAASEALRDLPEGADLGIQAPIPRQFGTMRFVPPPGRLGGYSRLEPQ